MRDLPQSLYSPSWQVALGLLLALPRPCKNGYQLALSDLFKPLLSAGGEKQSFDQESSPVSPMQSEDLGGSR